MDPPEPFDDSFVVDAVSSSPSTSIKLFGDADLDSDMTVKVGRSWRGQAGVEEMKENVKGDFHNHLYLCLNPHARDNR